MYTSAHYVSSNLENRPQRSYFCRNILSFFMVIIKLDGTNRYFNNFKEFSILGQYMDIDPYTVLEITNYINLKFDTYLFLNCDSSKGSY